MQRHEQRRSQWITLMLYGESQPQLKSGLIPARHLHRSADCGSAPLFVFALLHRRFARQFGVSTDDANVRAVFFESL